MKTTLKKILIALSVVVLMAAVFCFNAGALGQSEIYREDNYTYTVSDGRATIVSAYNYSMGDMVIPSEIGGYPVVALGEKAVNGEQGVSFKVTLPETVAEIDPTSFTECANLSGIEVSKNNPYFSSKDGVLYNKSQTKLISFPQNKSSAYTIPQTVKEIGDYAFWGVKLSEISVPKGVTYIGECAFAYAEKLEEFAIPESVTYIGKYAFACNYKLKTISTTDKIEYIGTGAFNSTGWWNAQEDGAVYLGKVLVGVKGKMPSGSTLDVKEDTVCISNFSNTSDNQTMRLNIPASVKYIAEGSLSNSGYLNFITLDENNPYFCLEDNILYNKDKTRIIWASYFAPESIVIPGTVETVDSSVFENCTMLKEITIPESLKKFGEDAFWNGGLKVNIESMEAWLNIEFVNESSNPLLKNGELYLNGEKVTELVIPDNVKEIKAYAFAGCGSITALTSGDKLEAIGYNAFEECVNLKKIDLQKGSVKIIESHVFYGCCNLTDFNAPSVTETNSDAFFLCNELESINLPSLVYANANDYTNTKWLDRKSVV